MTPPRGRPSPPRLRASSPRVSRVIVTAASAGSSGGRGLPSDELAPGTSGSANAPLRSVLPAQSWNSQGTSPRGSAQPSSPHQHAAHGSPMSTIAPMAPLTSSANAAVTGGSSQRDSHVCSATNVTVAASAAVTAEMAGGISTAPSASAILSSLPRLASLPALPAMPALTLALPRMRRQKEWFQEESPANVADIPVAGLRTAEEFEAVMMEVSMAAGAAMGSAEGRLVIVDFFAPWCDACKAVYPTVCEIAEKNPDVVFLKFNLADNRDLGKALGVKILPFFHFYRGQPTRLDAVCATIKTYPRLEKFLKKSAEVLASMAAVECVRRPWRGGVVAVVLVVVTLALLVPRGVTAKLSTMTVLDSPIRDTQWVGPSDEIVFTVTEAGHVWVSRDGGVSWNDHSAQGKLPGGTDIPSAKGAYEPPKGVQAFYFHPSTPEKMFFRGGGDTHWITTNAGESYDRVEGPAGHMGVATVRLHPMESDWVLAMVRRWACWSKDDTQRGACADDLFLTKDFGRTWQNLTERAQGRVLGFVDFDWGWSKTPGQMNHHTSYTRDTILATVFENRDEVREHLRANGVALATGWDAYVDFVHTSDYFGSKHTRTVPCGNQFEIMNDKLFLAVAEGCSEAGARTEGGRSGVRLKISADYGGSFRDACFPRPLVQRGYSVVHTTADTAFVNVDYAEGSRVSPYGDLLVADESLSLFGLALRRNARSISGAVDFAALQGLPGVYVANQLSEYVEPPAAKHGGAGTTEEDDMTFARSTTLITFNSGASWEPIKAPEYDTNRHPIHCDPRDGCSLHLHGTTSWIGGSGFAFVYSHASTPGLIISTGNVGTFLYQDSTINTYLSRDGGQTWEEVAKGSHIYEFGDSGGVIVMTKHGLHTASSTVMYSLDEGLTWEEEAFAEAEQQVDIFNIRVEPDNQGKKFLIQGLTMDDGTGKARQGVLISLDFTALPEYKLCKSSDYEFWTPTASRCFLGQNISIQRQPRSSKCWNGESYKRPENQITECECSENDYQCDFGTEPDATEPTTCRHLSAFAVDSCPALAGKGFKPNPDNKRQIAGDKCKGHWSGAGSKSSSSFTPGATSSSYSGAGFNTHSTSSSSSWFHSGGGSSGSSGSSSSSWFHPRGSSSSSSSISQSGTVSQAGVSSHTRYNPPSPSEAYESSSSSSSSGSGSGSERHGWGIFGTIFAVLLLVVLAGIALTMLAARGLLPDSILRYVPYLENVRYQNLRSNFQSLAHDFGLGGGDDDYEEMYRRP
ncbi:unnamed protein product [Closterium sp. NIES-53]